MSEVNAAPRKTQKLKEAEFVIFRLADSEKNHESLRKHFGGVLPEFRPLTTIPYQDTIVTPDGYRQTRYIEGFRTIYVDEQVAQKIPDSLIRSAKPIEFIDGYLRVHKSNKQLLEYLRTTNYNEDNPNRDSSKRIFFKEIKSLNPAGISDKDWKYVVKAVEISDSLKDEEIIPLAKFLRIATYDSFAMGDRLPHDVLEDLKAYALKKPKAFVEAYNNPTLETSYLITQALEKNIITLGKGGGQVNWTGSGALITTIPVDKDHRDSLVDFAYTEQGAKFLVALKAALNNSK